MKNILTKLTSSVSPSSPALPSAKFVNNNNFLIIPRIDSKASFRHPCFGTCDAAWWRKVLEATTNEGVITDEWVVGQKLIMRFWFVCVLNCKQVYALFLKLQQLFRGQGGSSACIFEPPAFTFFCDNPLHSLNREPLLRNMLRSLPQHSIL